MQEKLTIQDIARLVEAPKATISRILSQKSSVASALSERLLSRVQKHNLVPRVTEIGLADGRTPFMGVQASPEIIRSIADSITHTSYKVGLQSISSSKGNCSDVRDGNRDHPIRLQFPIRLIVVGIKRYSVRRSQQFFAQAPQTPRTSRAFLYPIQILLSDRHVVELTRRKEAGTSLFRSNEPAVEHYMRIYEDE